MKNGNIVDVCGVQQAAYLLVTAFHAVGRQTPLGGFDLEMGGTDTTHIKLRSEQMVQDGKVIVAFASVSMMTRTRQASGGANPSRARSSERSM